jgi:hypothetical protein
LTRRAIDFRRMTEKEYANYMETQLETYAQVRARAFRSSMEEELALAKKASHRIIWGLSCHGLRYLFP